MKERIVYDKYVSDKKPFGWIFYKKKQYLTWKFYLRVIMKHFVPCEKCQEKIDKLWNVGYFLSADWYNNTFLQRVTYLLCKQCNKAIYEVNENTEVIIGNKAYEPPVEISRKWTDDDNSIEDVTKEEYNKHKHPAFRV